MRVGSGDDEPQEAAAIKSANAATATEGRLRGISAIVVTQGEDGSKWRLSPSVRMLAVAELL